MIQVVDVVNFNADASCLPAADWLAALKGGRDSRMCSWLRLYVEEGRRVVLGLTGASVADMAVLNPESIEFANAYPDIFEVILRPFSHDIALLRSPPGFALNVKTGRDTIEKEFSKVTPYFLPAEFMLTNAQVWHLERVEIQGTFVNAARFKPEIRSRIPRLPYLVKGIFSSRLRCIPFQGELSEAYLRSLHQWESLPWNQALTDLNLDLAFSWRDGESFFFVPDGVERERAWLRGEAPEIQRSFLADATKDLVFQELEEGDPKVFHSFPVHSFSDWIKEFRMLGFLERLTTLERKLEDFDSGAKALWFQAINSDVLSAVEKDSPVISIRTAPPGDQGNREIRWTIQRSERGFEGEEFLEMLESYPADGSIHQLLKGRAVPHLEKLRARWTYLGKTLG
jgi:hypothetical protein